MGGGDNFFSLNLLIQADFQMYYWSYSYSITKTAVNTANWLIPELKGNEWQPDYRRSPLVEVISFTLL